MVYREAGRLRDTSKPMLLVKRGNHFSRSRLSSWKLVSVFRIQNVVLWSSLAVLTAMQLTLIWNPTVGIYLNAAAVVYFSALAISSLKVRPFAVAMAVLPVINIATIAIAPDKAFTAATVYYVLLLLLGLSYRYIFTLDYPTDYTRLLHTRLGYTFSVPLMFVGGQVIGALGYLFMHDHYHYIGTPLPLVAVAVAVFGIAEEVFLRGLLQQQALRFLHPGTAAFASAFVGSVLVINFSTALVLPAFILLQAACALTYAVKQNLLLTIILNVMSKLAFVGLVATFVLR